MSHSQHKNNGDNLSRTIIPFLHPSAEKSGLGNLSQLCYVEELNTYIHKLGFFKCAGKAH